jgi:hypothetical protein
MTLLATLLTTLLSFLSLGGVQAHDGFITKDDDLRDKNHQEAFHEEDMFSAGQMCHCPHG